MSACAFTSVCPEDAGWVDAYLAEAERLALPFAVHLDRWAGAGEAASAAGDRLTGHRLCVGFTTKNEPGLFRETDKQAVFDLVTSLGFAWALAWDVDEVFEREFVDPELLAHPELAGRADCLTVRWLNLWGDRDHVRVDGTWAEPRRVKFYNLAGGRRWRFDHPITNGAKLAGREARVLPLALVCLHAGMMTPELRRLHKARWDRIYSTALRGDPNPYGFWREAVATEGRAVTVRHGYF